LASNAQGLEVIIIVVHVGVVKTYVATVVALTKRKDRIKLSLPPKLMVFSIALPPSPLLS
jgi:hypothetical protein